MWSRWAGPGAGGSGSLRKELADLIQHAEGSQTGSESKHALRQEQTEAAEKTFGFQIH